MRFRVALIAVIYAGIVSSSANADDIGAAARGVVRVIAAVSDEANPENSSVALGSGFAISPHRVLTNAHVVEGVEDTYGDSVVAVVPSEGSRPLRATIVAYDPALDLAVLDVGLTRLEPLAIYSGPVQAGDHAAALGYPGNVDMATAQSITDFVTPTQPVRSEGNISSMRTVDGKSALLHTAAMSHGNSGGPLVDDCGRVLGVNTYVTNSGSGDAPFGFAIVSQAVMSFLRDHGEQFQQVGFPCVTMAEQAQHEQQAQEAARRDQQIADQREAQAQQQRIALMKGSLQDSRENYEFASGLLAVFAVFAGAAATGLFWKDRPRAGGAAAIIALAGFGAGTYAFLNRPSPEASLPVDATPASASVTPLAGKLLCRVQPALSRVTVSSTDDLAMTWDTNGCMNGRTQYVDEGANWRRVLVPNGSETVYVQDFDPMKRQYVSTRYLLPQADMDRLRQIRAADTVTTCSPDPSSIQQLNQVTKQLTSSLPSQPNEELVYSCSQQF